MAIINLSHNFIFVHVPKTAGTTVTRALSQYTQFSDIEIGATPLGEEVQPYYLKRFGLRKHSTARDILKVTGPEFWSKAFKFTFARNPFARCYSSYNFLKFEWRAWKGSEIMDSFASFEEFVASDFFEGNGPDSQFRPQWWWLRDESGDGQLVDTVGRVESIATDLPAIIEKFGRRDDDPPLQFDAEARSNTSAKADEWRDHVQGETGERIVRRYSVDFQRLGYPATPQG